MQSQVALMIGRIPRRMFAVIGKWQNISRYGCHYAVTTMMIVMIIVVYYQTKDQHKRDIVTSYPNNIGHKVRKTREPAKKKASLSEDQNGNIRKGNHLSSTNDTSATVKPLIVSPIPINSNDEIEITRYHVHEYDQCKKKIANRSETIWCPCLPPGLRGRVMVDMNDDMDWTNVTAAVREDMFYGGEWRPDNCVSHTRLAIVIPCRDREGHLRILLRHIIPILKRQLLHFRIFVVDQRFPHIFNKAAVMNIGVLEAEKRFSFDCVIFHDVDMMLEDDRALMKCGSAPRHYARAVDRMSYQLYPTFGGVTSITPEMFRKVNGFPLRFFGWGGENDDMWSRVKQFWEVYALPAAIGRYSTIPHSRDVTNLENTNRHSLLRDSFSNNANHSFEGLSNLIYRINDVQVRQLYTRIEADIDISKLPYPKHRPILALDYSRVKGMCLDPDVVLTLVDVSWNSCLFHCHMSERESCFGFSHVRGICSIIRTSCYLNAKSNGWTYVRKFNRQ